MSDFDTRAHMVAGWFERHLIESRSGGAGWGWVPEVPPNPQNTAEVVCALTRTGRPVPNGDAVIEMMRREVVTHAAQGSWVFRSPVDLAWRLRGLRCMIDDHDDIDIALSAANLVAAQNPSGGWPLTSDDETDSVTATCLALHAISGLQSADLDIEQSVGNGVRTLIDAVLADDPRTEPLHASSQIVQILALPGVAPFSGPRIERAREQTLACVSAHLERGSADIEEEVFVREGVTDLWRHMTLYMALAAQAEGAPERIVEPFFRGSLIKMLSLQECDADNVNFGGFRTSKNGFVTSFATTQAVHALAAVDTKLREKVNPGLAFELLCSADGAHHSDPQKVVTIGKRTVMMNSWAGALILLIGALAGLTVAAFAIGFQDPLGNAGSRLLLIWSLLFLAGGAFSFALVRWPDLPRSRIALGLFTAFSAILLPIVFFVLE
jgi:hypothetical protein